MLLSLVLLFAALLLQSTILAFIAIADVKPDISLIILVFIAIHTGRMVGQLSGFISGLIQDFLSLSPLGFHSLIRTILGFLFGSIQGSVLINSLFLPVLFVLVATVTRELLSAIISVIFSTETLKVAHFNVKFWIEVAYNSLLAPFLFSILNIIKIYKFSDREAA